MTKIPGSTLIDVVGLYLVCSSYIVSFDLLAIVPRMYTQFPASQRHQKAKTKLCSFHVLFDKLEALETFYPNNSSAREGPFYPYPLCQWISSRAQWQRYNSVIRQTETVLFVLMYVRPAAKIFIIRNSLQSSSRIYGQARRILTKLTSTC